MGTVDRDLPNNDVDDVDSASAISAGPCCWGCLGRLAAWVSTVR